MAFSRWAPFALAFVGALVVAEVAVLALEPRRGLSDLAMVRASSYFTPEQLGRARDFRRPQLALVFVALGVHVAVLAWLAARPPRWLPRRAVLAGATVSLLLTATSLPLSALGRARAIDVGLAIQSWAAWAGDKVKSAAIGAALAGVAAGLVMFMIRRLPRTWWVPASALVIVVGAGYVYAGPVVLDPLFNRFQPLSVGQTRADVLQLARRTGVDVGDVYVVDASRRTTAANAYVTGLGPTKRVVLYDTLIESFAREEIRLVVAHELGHVAYRDVPNGLLYLALVAPAGMFAVSRVRPRTVAGLWLAVVVVATPITWVSHQLSRSVEARADAFSLRLTGSPESFISFERRITLRNVGDPDPPAVPHALLGTHPTVMARIAMAEAYRERSR